MTELEALYRHRFSEEERQFKDRLWQVLCRSFLQRYVNSEDTVLDLACGFGEFSRHITARRKVAVDLNAAAAAHLPVDVEFHACAAHRLDFLPTGSVDVCFTSNFLEHLPDKEMVDAVLREVHRVLKSGGRFLAIQPNMRYAYREYWDFWDHLTPLSHLSCAEALTLAGFEVEELIPRFLPFRTKNRVPTWPALLQVYLAIPALWRLFGKQFFVAARKPESNRAT